MQFCGRSATTRELVIWRDNWADRAKSGRGLCWCKQDSTKSSKTTLVLTLVKRFKTLSHHSDSRDGQPYEKPIPALTPNPRGRGPAQRPTPRGGKPPHRRTPEGNPSREARSPETPRAAPTQAGEGPHRATPTPTQEGADPGDPEPRPRGERGETTKEKHAR